MRYAQHTHLAERPRERQSKGPARSCDDVAGGSFDSEDDEFRAPRNTLYIGATLSQDIRDAVSGISPASLGEGSANGTVKISSVMDLASETYRLIDGLKEFRIVGIDLTVPDGEDESLTLVAADGRAFV